MTEIAQMASDMNRQRGAIMMEVVVAIFFVTTVFIGHIGSQVFMQKSSVEAGRRAQAYTIVNNMVERMQANRQAARCYAISNATGSPYVGVCGGVPGACADFGDPDTQAVADSDIQAWHDLLVDGAATNAGGDSIGGLKNGRGCIILDETTDPDTYSVSIAWEGSDSLTIAGNAGLPCAQGSYGSEALRRVISVDLQFADLF